MIRDTSKTTVRWRQLKPLLATGLAVGGAFNLLSAVLADTAAGTRITNQATATYEDQAGQRSTATSNTVVIEVAEVAGITVRGYNVEKVTVSGTTVTPQTGPPNPGDQVAFYFRVTNVGNDATKFSLPNTVQRSGPLVSTDLIQYEDPANPGSWITLSGRTESPSVLPNGVINVRVVATISTQANSGDDISVRLGDSNGQNQPVTSTSGGDVFTVDNTGNTAPGEASANPPANGTREASDILPTKVGAQPRRQPLVTIEKRYGTVTPNNASLLNDDIIPYTLTVDVKDTAPAGSGVLPADLESIAINLDGGKSNRILVSDALPAGTALETTQPTPPAGWTLVYTDTPVSTPAIAANWTTNRSSLTTITRVGFVSAPGATLAVTDPLVTFNLALNTSQVPAAAQAFAIANIAQVFGSGIKDDPNTPANESLTFPVMDESGDTVPSNYNPDPNTQSRFSNYNPTVPGTNAGTGLPNGFVPPDGYINDGNDLNSTGEDTGNNSSGDPLDGGGEAVVIRLLVPGTTNLLNGPLDNAGAVGPTGNNDDFTNKGAPVPANYDPATYNPSSVGFTNTVKNTGNTAGTVTLTPQTPANAADLPANTTLTLVSPTGDQVRQYRYNGSTWTRLDGSPINPATDLVTFPLAKSGDPTDTKNYAVEIDLPAGTPLSTDINRGFPVPIRADLESNGNPGDGPEATNVTIDRVYTGFIKLVKASQVLVGSGPAVQPGDAVMDTNPKTPAPGNVIRYRVTYRNISEGQVGSGNVLLLGSNIRVDENGTLADTNGDGRSDIANANNWALDNDNDNQIDTVHVFDSAFDSRGGNVTYFNGSPATNQLSAQPSQAGVTVNNDVTRYLANSPAALSPGQSGYFQFERTVNSAP